MHQNISYSKLEELNLLQVCKKGPIPKICPSQTLGLQASKLTSNAIIVKEALLFDSISKTWMTFKVESFEMDTKAILLAWQ